MAFFKRDIKPVTVAGQPRFKVEADPSAMAFNTPEEAEKQRDLLDTFKPLDDGRRED